MNTVVTVRLDAQPAQLERLRALQTAFAEVCNALAPVVQRTRVWNRVALHHLTYRDLRTRYPALGSQMVCNAIYSVSRTCRMVFQSPSSPFHLARLGQRSLPLLRFSDTCPVYFDRHTLSMKGGQLSLFTLDGRMRFQLALNPVQETAFQEKKLLEIVLQRRGECFELRFIFAEPAHSSLARLEEIETNSAIRSTPQALAEAGSEAGHLPEYVLIEETT